jgi:hypothetical protein
LPQTASAQSLPASIETNVSLTENSLKQATSARYLPRADPTSEEDRDVAYLECGYRTVDESDVMILLLNGRSLRLSLLRPRSCRMRAQWSASLLRLDRQSPAAGLCPYALTARRPLRLLKRRRTTLGRG